MNEQLKHPEVEYEHSDLSALGILGFLAGLAIVGFVIHIILVGMFVYLDTFTKRHEAATSPLAPATARDLRNPNPQVANEFPLPRLETNELGELNDQRLQEENTLNTYGWVDQKAGIAHIPIERAMQLLAQRGLPVAPPNMQQKNRTQVVNNPAGAGPARR
ncbi:MAG TPA: hypothetical protein VMT53_03060 [Terriglobales bacterium]|nr:hypothetical protein [Terriglobales bacterium]